jgi:hypothetical protein
MKPSEMSAEHVEALLQELEAQGVRLLFSDEGGQIVSNHDKIRSLVSTVVATAFLSAVGFAFQSPKGVWSVPDRVGSVRISRRQSYTLKGVSGGSRVVPETVRVRFTPSRQLQKHLAAYARDQQPAAQHTAPQDQETP